MDLILWRHAEAAECPGALPGSPQDLERVLTPRGEKQAARVAVWLDRQLPEGARILVSPARRCEQTALALGRKYKIRQEVSPAAPGQGLLELLELIQWPHGKSPVLVIGHQPVLGQIVSQLLGLEDSDCVIRKGAVWWLRNRDREGTDQTVVISVQSPDAL